MAGMMQPERATQVNGVFSTTLSSVHDQLSIIQGHLDTMTAVLSKMLDPRPTAPQPEIPGGPNKVGTPRTDTFESKLQDLHDRVSLLAVRARNIAASLDSLI